MSRIDRGSPTRQMRFAVLTSILLLCGGCPDHLK